MTTIGDDKQKLQLRKLRILIGTVVVFLVLSGLTAFPLAWELELLHGFTGIIPLLVAHEWIRRLNTAKKLPRNWNSYWSR